MHSFTQAIKLHWLCTGYYTWYGRMLGTWQAMSSRTPTSFLSPLWMCSIATAGALSRFYNCFFFSLIIINIVYSSVCSCAPVKRSCRAAVIAATAKLPGELGEPLQLYYRSDFHRRTTVWCCLPSLPVRFTYLNRGCCFNCMDAILDFVGHSVVFLPQLEKLFQGA